MKIISNKFNFIYLSLVILLIAIFVLWIYCLNMLLYPHIVNKDYLLIFLTIFLMLFLMIAWMSGPLISLFKESGFLKYIDFQHDKIQFGGLIKRQFVEKSEINKIFYFEKTFRGELHISTNSKHYKMNMMLTDDQIEQLRKEIKNV